MPLNIPNLDDRKYADLVEEGVGMLPRYAPSWTNHNPSDPGITLVELFAYFAELLIYRLNRVTRETKIRFLDLLGGPNAHAKERFGSAPLEEVDEALRQAVANLRRRDRAVAPQDYEFLAMEATAHKSEESRVFRAGAFVKRNLQSPDPAAREQEAPGHVSVVVLPAGELEESAFALVLAQVREYLEPRRLLTTRLHVVEPFYLWAAVGGTIYPRRDLPQEEREDIRERAIERLRQFFSARLGGGPQGQGWPFGRALYLSEVYQALEQVPGVDYVEDVRVLRLATTGAPEEERTRVGIQLGLSRVGIDSRLGVDAETAAGRLLRDTAGRLAVVSLRPFELIRIASHADDFKIAGAPGAEEKQTLQ